MKLLLLCMIKKNLRLSYWEEIPKADLAVLKIDPEEVILKAS